MYSLFLMFSAPVAARALIKPIYSIGLVLFYYDQRIRKEGYDIEWMMQAAGLTPPAVAELPSTAELTAIPPQDAESV